jgi:predicted AAA+ superfamily ATPase
MTLWKHASVRKDVFDKELDRAVAPSLSEVVLGIAHKIYVDPEEFINITYPTDTIRKIVNEVVEAFVAGTGKTIILPSAFGGGKTHIMILLYHLIKKLSLLPRLLGEGVRSKTHALEEVEVIVIDGTDKRTSPSPLPGEALEENGVKVSTLWGYLAYKLNAYEKMRKYDELLTSPEKSVLSQIFSGKKVLVLIDELGIYYNRLARVPHPEKAEVLRKYAEQVVIFLRMLSESVKDSCVVVVLSIPAEPTERGLEPESGYEEFVKKIEQEVSRTAIRAEKPIATNEDFANILKKRLFDKVDVSRAQLVSRRLRSLHDEHRDLVKDVSVDVEKYYPFHPLFITTLREIVEKNKDLQKTRDALRIARKVLRNLYDKVKDLSLIMPADIDLRVEEVRTSVITERYLGFDLVVSKIIDKAREIPVEEGVDPEVYRDLAYRLALYVILRTYIYDPYLEPRSEFPGKSEVVTGVYDPVRYEQYLISPPRVSELLDKLSSGSIEYRMPHLYGREGYYWVTRLLDIKERVEKEAEKVEDVTALNYVLREIDALFTKPYEGREEAKPTVFSSKPTTLLEAKPIEEDSPEYKLVVIASPLNNVREGVYNSGDLYDIIYYRLSGRQKAMRRYQNTIAVLFSNDAGKLKEIAKTAKMVVACEKLDRIVKQEYREETVVRILREEIKDLRESLDRSLKYKLVAQYFNLIAYPDVENKANVVRVDRVNPTRKTLVEIAEDTLRSLNKILEERYSQQFDVLVSLLEGGVREEIKWSREMKVNDVVNAFLENPGLPMIPARDVKRALLSGLRELKVGVVRNGKVYFKSVRGAETVSELGDADVVIPPEVAAEKQIEELSKVEEEFREGLFIRRYYVAVYDGKEIPIKDLKLRYPDTYVKVFIASEIKLREERIQHGFDVEVVPLKQELRLDEVPDQVTIKVFVKRIGSFESEVLLKPESGSAHPDRGVPDFESVWTLPVPKEPGEYSYTLRAEGAGLAKGVEVKLVIKKGLLCKQEPPEKVAEVTLRGDAEAAEVVEYLRVVNRSVQGVKVIRRCSVKVEFLERKPSEFERAISVSLEGVTIDDFATVVKALSSAFGVTAKVKCVGELRLEVVGEGKVTNLSELLSADANIKQRQVNVEYCW